MVSEEDIVAFNNDLRNKHKIIVEEPGKTSEDARGIWDFGKKIGLSGDEETMIAGLMGLEPQVSPKDPLDKENLNEGF